jgi:hypothetical protein
MNISLLVGCIAVMLGPHRMVENETHLAARKISLQMSLNNKQSLINVSSYIFVSVC